MSKGAYVKKIKSGWIARVPNESESFWNTKQEAENYLNSFFKYKNIKS